MSDALSPYREAHERTGEALHRAASLSRALYDLALAHPTLGSSDLDAEAIVSLIVVLGEKATAAAELHGVEHGLAVRLTPGAEGV